MRLDVRPLPFLPRALLIAAGIAAMGLLVAFGFVKCTFAELFHIPCPGCGMTRSVLALLHFDFRGVFRYNPFGPVHVGITAWIMGRSLVAIARDGSLASVDRSGEGKWMLYAFIGLQIAQLVLWGLRWFGLFGGPCPV